MKIALASDHAGFRLKTDVIAELAHRGVPYEDFGCYREERADYVDFAAAALESVTAGRCDRAVLVCGTGLGMAIVGNKFRGIRATSCVDAYTAEMSRKHNDSNCLTLGGRILPADEALEIVRTWLETPFEAGRHQQRLDKIAALEEKNFK